MATARHKDFTVPTDWVRDLIQIADPGPGVLARALAAADLHWTDLSADGRSIGQRQEVRFVLSLHDSLGGGHASAELGLRMPGRTSTVVSYLEHSSRTLGEALAALARYLRLTRPGARLGFAVAEGRGVLSLDHLDPWTWHSAPYQEFVVSTALASFRTSTGQPVSPLAVGLSRASEGREPRLEEIWGAPVSTGEDRARMTFGAEALALPLVGYDAPLLAHLKRYGDLLLRSAPEPHATLRHQVEAAILDRLPRGAPPVADVASDLGLSVRTLTRRLAEDSLTYRGLVEDVRRQKAERMLADPRLSLAEIAFLLGYAEQSSFTNAFRRWTGTAPGAYRSAQGL